ncbi:DUF4192 domain-containing protein [Amycolatopsis sp. CA-230715]|uniref:DUF4192 domain-containing protein n=1 Tax=Amycolatopsis sp. CA-230715 TaxID=2745196 RepID=UPI001C02B576|nr:DUF4192 domain-containing protein [Amycolatopsis sp. CA-230715]QWF77570.1 hypothetical protein HUW46_00962 [Amycolatopsis sp. CA-230715]
MTTPTTATRHQVRLRDPGELIASTPSLVGFRPTDSLVVHAHQGTRIAFSLRLDLPSPEHLDEVAATAAGLALGTEPTGITVVAVGGDARGAPPGEVPNRALVEAVIDDCAAAGVPLVHAMWAREIRKGAPWRCYRDPACGGTLPEPESTVAAAATAAIGRVVYDSREEMESLLAPDDVAEVARRAVMLAETSGDLSTGEARAALRDALDRVARPGFALSNADIATLARAMSVAAVRDACLATALPPGSAEALSAERLWTELTRLTPAPERAAPATLLGYSAYLRGECALAGMALEEALAADPGYVLAQLLRAGLSSGLSPERLAGIADIAEISLDESDA